MFPETIDFCTIHLAQRCVWLFSFDFSLARSALAIFRQAREEFPAASHCHCHRSHASDSNFTMAIKAKHKIICSLLFVWLILYELLFSLE
jgi:hypothetical protein